MFSKTNTAMTYAGVLAAVSTGMLGIPIAVSQYYAQIVKSGPPEWWNACVFPMILFGLVGNMIGVAIMGVVGKGQDQHSTLPQMEASTAKAVAEGVVSKVDAQPGEPLPAVKVEIVKPQDPEKP